MVMITDETATLATIALRFILMEYEKSLAGADGITEVRLWRRRVSEVTIALEDISMPLGHRAGRRDTED